jgi:hypothetical protein
VKLWLTDNLLHALSRGQAIVKPTSPDHWLNLITEGKIGLEALMGRSWFGEDEETRTVELEMRMWDLRLTRDRDIYEDESKMDAARQESYDRDPYTAEWDVELIFQCQMRIFGVLTVGDEKSLSYHRLHREDPFRNVVAMMIGFDVVDMNPHSSSLDFWKLLEERAIRATRNAHWLRETLAIEYFFHPEDQPYRASPRLYRTAAVADIMVDDEIYNVRLSYVPALHVLFQVDPRALPREDPALIAWAAIARQRMFDFFGNMEFLCHQRARQKQRRGGRMNFSDRDKFRALGLQQKFRFEMDWKIVSYIETGSLGDVIPDGLAPDFTEPLRWLGERLEPWPKALDEATKLLYPNFDHGAVDEFEDESDYDLTHFDLPQEVMADALCDHFGMTEYDLQIEADFVLDRIDRAEARYALLTGDDYYQSQHHDDYEELCDTYVFTHAGDLESDGEEDGNSDEWADDSENEERSNADDDGRWSSASILRHGLLQEAPFHIHRELIGLDMAVMFPDDMHPLPSKDTESTPLYCVPPQWFRPAGKPYFEELPSAEDAKKSQNAIQRH